MHFTQTQETADNRVRAEVHALLGDTTGRAPPARPGRPAVVLMYTTLSSLLAIVPGKVRRRGLCIA
jgi:hypothetical protein